MILNHPLVESIQPLTPLIQKNFKWAIQKYKEIYDFDLSYMKLQISNQPCYNNGKPNLDMKPEEFGGCWTKLKFVRINPDIQSVMKYYRVKTSIDEFNRQIIGHELAHEIYNNVCNEYFKKWIATKARKEEFHTIYLDHVELNKLREEIFCEYLANSIVHPIEHSHFYKAIVNGKEVGKYGLSFYEDIKAVGIGSFEIYPQYRNKGYGTAVIKQIIDKYKDKYDWIYCFVEADNEGAIRFYKRIGTVSTTKTNSYKVGSTEYRNSKGQYLVTLYKKSNEFDEKELDKLTNIKDRIKYCNSHLKYIAHGIGKRVYAIDNDYVLKLAYNKEGYWQNGIEIELSKYNFPFLAQVKSYGHKSTYIIAERCFITLDVETPANVAKYENEIKKVTGYDATTIWSVGDLLITDGGAKYYKFVRKELEMACDKIVENNYNNIAVSFDNIVRNTCNELDISKDKKIILEKKFWSFLWCLAKRLRKNNSNFDYQKIFKIVDSGEYRKIRFINDILKVKNIETVIDFNDCFNIYNTGIVNRNGKNYLVILDYGYHPNK